MRIPRPVLIIGAILLIALLGALLAVNLWLASWVPANGKAWVETQLNHALPLRVTIGTMRYSVWQGFLLDDVRAVDPATGTMWLDAPHLQARLGVLRFLLQRQVAFRMKTALKAPCDTMLSASGRYGLNTRHLIVDLLTPETAVDRVIPEAAAFLPNVKGGRVRVKLRVNWQPDQPPVFTGRLVGTSLVWEQHPLRITSDVIADGTVVPPSADGAPLKLNLQVDLEKGLLQGLPWLKTAGEVAGTLHVTEDRLDITALHGISLATPWQLDGTVSGWSAPDVDLTLRTTVDLTTLARHLADAAENWHPAGEARVTVTCRGPAAAWPDLEMNARVEVRNASCALPMAPRFPHRFEQLHGSLQYEHLIRRLTIDSLAGQVQQYPVTLQGSIQFRTPPVMTFVAETQADLAIVTDLLPAEGPVQSTAGPVSVHVELSGTPALPAWNGTAVLTDAAIVLRAWPSTIEQLRGSIRFTNQDISTQQLTCMLAGQPVTMTGTVTGLTTTPRIVGQAKLTDGTLALDVSVLADQFVVQAAEAAIGSSRLRVKGRISRLHGQTSQLTAAGTLRMTDLPQVPWVDASALKPWGLEGDVAVQARLSGPLDEPRALAAAGLIQSEQLVIKGVPIRAITAELEQGPQRWSLRVTEAMIASGKLTGEFLLERSESARYLLEGDLTMADMQQLAASLPAWRGRDLQGTLSAHTSIVGAGKDRSKMQGDGWLQAEGERLGEVPLMDGLFRGVFGALADRLGLTMLRKAQITKVAGQWRLVRERLWTEDLRVTGLSGTEPVMLIIRGSVGLDKTLDLVVEPELSEQLLTQAPNMSALSGTILKVMGGLERARGLVGRHHLSGTIDKPQYKFEFSLDQVLNQNLPAGIGQLLDSLR